MFIWFIINFIFTSQIVKNSYPVSVTDKIKFNTPPVSRADRSIIAVDFNKSTTPSYFESTAKVATHGKYIDKTTDETISE